MKYLFLVLALATVLSCNSDKHTYCLIETDFGDIKVVLYEETPNHKENFIKLVEEGFYDDLMFHRVMKGFMIQGGDPSSKNARPGQRLGMGGPGYQIDAEIGAPHIRGTLAAARTPDAGNPEKRSSGSQFYIVHGGPVNPQLLDQFERMKGITYNETQRSLYEQKGGAPQLDMDYTVFGEVVEGLDVVDAIALVTVDPANRPLEDIRMKISIVK